MSRLDDELKALGVDIPVTPSRQPQSAAEALAWEVDALRIRYAHLLKPVEAPPPPDNVIAFPTPGSDEPDPTESMP